MQRLSPDGHKNHSFRFVHDAVPLTGLVHTRPQAPQLLVEGGIRTHGTLWVHTLLGVPCRPPTPRHKGNDWCGVFCFRSVRCARHNATGDGSRSLSEGYLTPTGPLRQIALHGEGDLSLLASHRPDA